MKPAKLPINMKPRSSSSSSKVKPSSPKVKASSSKVKPSSPKVKPSSPKVKPSSPKAKTRKAKVPIQHQDLMAHKIQRSFRSKMASKKKTLKLSLNRVLPEGVAGKAYNYL